MSNNESKIVSLIFGDEGGEELINYFFNNRYVKVSLIITSSPNINKYIKWKRYSRYLKLNKTKLIIDSNLINQKEKLIACKPDFIFVNGWSKLIDDTLISIPKEGMIGFHPSILPNDRGRSVIAWQIEEGYSETGVTMFYYNSVPDGGDIIACEKIKIKDNDYLIDVLDKMQKATINLLKSYFPLLRKGIRIRQKQEISEGNFRRLRNDDDSIINWKSNSIEIYNKIRAISYPYPGAILRYENKSVRVWQSTIVESDSLFSLTGDCVVGQVCMKLKDNNYLIKCKDGRFIRIKCDIDLAVGAIL